jgi:hypothetical protein
MEQFKQVFENIKHAFDNDSIRHQDLVCWDIDPGGHCIKLIKESWVNPGALYKPNHNGIFFSLWFDKDDLVNNRISYNIHAIKLRDLVGYKITSINFANEFREKFEKHRKDWPNVSTEFVHHTLMQGWIEIKPDSFEQDILGLFRKFNNLVPIIDKMLADRVKHTKASRLVYS